MSDRSAGLLFWKRAGTGLQIDSPHPHSDCAGTDYEAFDTALQDRLLDEAFAVVRAKGIDVDESGLRQAVKDNCWKKYNKPSMLQHMEAGRRTEIDALNGALVREARALGLAVPCHETVVAFTKGRELGEHRRLQEPGPDDDLLERQAGDEQRPGQDAA